MRNKILFLILGLSLVFANLYADGPAYDVFTPNGSQVQALILDENSASVRAQIDATCSQSYPNAQQMITYPPYSSSRRFNCHGYAWFMSELPDPLGSPRWIGTTGNEEDIYWTDGSYVLAAGETYPAKVSYASDDHSAITTNSSGWFISKWGQWPLVRHRWDDTPYSETLIRYYVRTATQTFYNVVKSGTFTRNNCGSSYYGNAVTYTVPAGTYTSTVSQADADQMAQNDVNANGQNYANVNGTCTLGAPVTYTNTSTMPYTVIFTNTSTSVQYYYSSYPTYTNYQVGVIPFGTYNISFTPYSTASTQLIVNGVTYTGSSYNLTNIGISGPFSFTINPQSGGGSGGPGPCTFLASSGFYIATSGLSSSGSTASGYVVFVNNSYTLSPGQSYKVATFACCKPSSNRTYSTTVSGRSWTLTFKTNGELWASFYGSTLPVNSNTYISFNYTL